MTATNPNDQAVSLVPSAEAVVRPQTAGQLLREARLKAGVHLAVLSVTLKVPVRQLEALEADQLDLAKGAVFLRGLASSVCRHLNTDPAPILALLPQPNGAVRTRAHPEGPWTGFATAAVVPRLLGFCADADGDRRAGLDARACPMVLGSWCPGHDGRHHGTVKA
jgi:hypothetical protein